jgi:FdhD protein
MQRNNGSSGGRPGAVRAAAKVLAFADRGPSGPQRERWVPVETAVQVTYTGLPFAVMMMTPGDLEDFAYGFSLTEGVIEGTADVRDLIIEEDTDGLRLNVDLAGVRLQEHLARRRAMTGRTGCGLCGITDFEALPRAARKPGAPPKVALEAIERALIELDEAQTLNRATHAVHAAAFAGLDGSIRQVREDVGRHNALDKLVGALLRGGIAIGGGFVVITSRCSYEMVEKAAAAGAHTLVAISAPTSLALERAQRLDLTLVGVARRDSIAVFHGMDRILVRENVA